MTCVDDELAAGIEAAVDALEADDDIWVVERGKTLEDLNEGQRAFAETRPPEWKSR